MEHEKYDIILVEDNPNDAELMVHSLKKNHLANKLIVLEDGEQALNYFFAGANMPKEIQTNYLR